MMTQTHLNLIIRINMQVHRKLQRRGTRMGGKGQERAKKCEIRPGKANVNNSKQRAVDDDTDSPEPYNTHKYAGALQISEAGHENGWERAGKGEKVQNKTWKGEC